MQMSDELKKVALRVSELYGCDVEAIEKLIELTSGVKGVSFVSINGYNSDASKNTEVANQLINIGANYDNMLLDAAIKYTDVDLSKMDVEGHNYQYIDTDGLSLEDFKKEVKKALPEALKALTTVKTPATPRADNDVYFNKALMFNLKTLRLSIRGTSLSKTVVEKGVKSKVKSAPLTVAKTIIRNYCEPKTDTIRRFALDNVKGLKLKGNTVEIGGGKEEEQFTNANTGAKLIPVAEYNKNKAEQEG